MRRIEFIDIERPARLWRSRPQSSSQIESDLSFPPCQHVGWRLGRWHAGVPTVIRIPGRYPLALLARSRALRLPRQPRPQARDLQGARRDRPQRLSRIALPSAASVRARAAGLSALRRPTHRLCRARTIFSPVTRPFSTRFRRDSANPRPIRPGNFRSGFVIPPLRAAAFPA